MKRCIPGLCGLLLAACSAAPHAGDPVVSFEPGASARAFDAARQALRDCGYRLDRVDSEHGVLTTLPRPAGGSPFTSTPAADLLHEQARVVRVALDRQGSARVDCFVSRVQTPEMHLSTRAIGLSATAYDPVAAERGLGFRYAAPLTHDEAEAARVADRIRRALGGDSGP
ncbi:MAG: hypothetical protein U0637_01175 [Phycisphaerales bacterium]